VKLQGGVFGSGLTDFNRSRRNKISLSILSIRGSSTGGCEQKRFFKAFHFTGVGINVIKERKQKRCVLEPPPISGQSRAKSHGIFPKGEKEKPYQNDLAFSDLNAPLLSRVVEPAQRSMIHVVKLGALKPFTREIYYLRGPGPGYYIGVAPHSPMH